MNIITLGNDLAGATFSPCMAYRYSLWRKVSDLPSSVAFIGLNPSTADHEVNDPTVTRCINYAKAWGAGRFYMLNLFAWRDTDPKLMKAAIEPIGIENNETLKTITWGCAIVVAAWGTHGKFKQRGDQVLNLLRDINLHCLKTTKAGCPQHPLYLKAELKPVIFQAARGWADKAGE